MFMMVVTLGMHRLVSDVSFDEAEWFDQRIRWVDRADCTMGILFNGDLGLKDPMKVHTLVDGGSAARSSLVSVGDELLRIDNVAVKEVHFARRDLTGATVHGTKSVNVEPGSVATVGFVKSRDLLVAPCTRQGQVVEVTIVRDPCYFYYYRGMSDLKLDRFLLWFGTLVSLGLLQPLLLFRLLKHRHKASHLHFGGFLVRFRGKLSDYVYECYLPNVMYTLGTLGIYALIGRATRRTDAWLDAHLDIAPHLDTSHNRA
mmetsp:Transcript_12476/g.34296  ORF Transcript_12476/g.34296 Transcript_12476/m.34296 type:complete len:258 (+) Transcript_12476:164-937(+)